MIFPPELLAAMYSLRLSSVQIQDVARTVFTLLIDQIGKKKIRANRH